MKKSCAELKQLSRITLQGKWTSVVLFTLYAFIMESLLSMCASPFAASTSGLGNLFYWAVSLIIALISGLFTAGTDYYYLNIRRGRPFALRDLFAAFRMSPDRFIIVTVITGAFSYACSVFTYFIEVEDTMLLLVIMLAESAAAILISLYFSLAAYLLLDFPDMGAVEALKLSARLMYGNKGRYFYMVLSFTGWIILSVFTMFIGFLWIIPYINMTHAYFYECIMMEAGYYNTEESAGEAETEAADTDTYETTL